MRKLMNPRLYFTRGYWQSLRQTMSTAWTLGMAEELDKAERRRLHDDHVRRVTNGA